MKINQKNKKRPTQKFVVLAVATVVIGLCTYAYSQFMWPSDGSVNNKSGESLNNPVKSTERTAIIPSSNQSEDPQSAQTSGISDKNGSDVTEETNGLSSSSKVITLYNPVNNQFIGKNTPLEGSAKVDQVNYRLKDDIHGVIGQGVLNVRNSFFSGTISANTDSKSGSLEVFSISDGREVNRIKIVVRH